MGGWAKEKSKKAWEKLHQERVPPPHCHHVRALRPRLTYRLGNRIAQQQQRGILEQLQRVDLVDAEDRDGRQGAPPSPPANRMPRIDIVPHLGPGHGQDFWEREGNLNNDQESEPAGRRNQEAGLVGEALDQGLAVPWAKGFFPFFFLFFFSLASTVFSRQVAVASDWSVRREARPVAISQSALPEGPTGRSACSKFDTSKGAPASFVSSPFNHY